MPPVSAAARAGSGFSRTFPGGDDGGVQFFHSAQ